jgi:NAD(P)H-hydrate epimerase
MPAPILSVAQMRRWENATWAAKRTPSQVISRVGHILTARVKSMTRPGDFIIILAGKGHNGDDARQIVQNLADREVTLINVFDPRPAIGEFNSLLSLPPALVVDGLFGIGLNRSLDSGWKRLIQCVNEARIPILAVDIPSGLDADTGKPQGAAVQATVTLTLGAPKPGLITSAAWPYVGRLEVATDIGLVPCAQKSGFLWSLAEDFADYPPRRPVEGHKGSFGHVAIFAGSMGYHGAAVLAARGALRARPGLVTVFTNSDVYVPVASQLSAAMVRPWKAGSPLPESCTAMVFGPGLADPHLPAELKRDLCKCWREVNIPVLADASGLDWLPSGRVVSKAIRLITPHPGEAARLLKTSTGVIQSNRAAAVRNLSKRGANCFVVLKGHQTVIGGSRGEIYWNSSGNPELAQGGSGDVLAGFLGGLLAQPALIRDPLLAIRYGVWQHGAAADRLAQEKRGWTVEDLTRVLGADAV